MTEGSFDAYIWQALETKASFIAQVITGENAVRRADDVASQELSYAEVKAIASGNPAVLTLAEADVELKRLAILKKNHADQQYLARLNLRELPKTIADLKQRLADLTADLETTRQNADDRVIIGDHAINRDDAIGVVGRQLESMPDNVRQIRRVPIGVYRGLRFGMVLHPQWPPEIYVEGAMTRRSTLSREHHGPRAILNALKRLADSYEAECNRTQQDLTIAENQLRDYETRLGNTFRHESYLSQLADLRDRLRACLSGAPADASTDSQPNSTDVAGQIKALKDANTIEATPQRIGKRRESAEEPVTARIRRHMESVLQASDDHRENVDEGT